MKSFTYHGIHGHTTFSISDKRYKELQKTHSEKEINKLLFEKARREHLKKRIK